MNAVLFFVGLLVVSSIVGAITNWLRNQKAAEQERQERLANARPLANRGRGDEPPTVPARPPASESTPAEVLNRYAAEVEKLRKRKAGAPPVVVPVAKKRAPDAPHSRVSSSPPPPPAPSAYQVTRAPQSQRQTGSLVTPRAEDLPVAPVIQPGAALPVPPKSADFSATSAPPGVRGGQSSTLEAFFRSPKNLAAAMMLSEILSKPKAYQNGSQKPSRPRDMDAGREPPAPPAEGPGPAESNGRG